MKQHRGQWSGGACPRKRSPLRATDSSLLLESIPMWNEVKDESGTWTDIVRVEESGSCWDSQTFDVSFFDDNRKIFQWDDSGAVDYLKKAEAKLQQGINSVYADYLNESNQFSATIDWDERWLCSLPDCAEEFAYRDEKRKNPKGSATRKDPADNASAVILGLPEPHNDTDCSTPSLRLPLHFVPFPTGWDEGEGNPADVQREDSPMQHLTAPYPEEIQVEPASRSWWRAPTNSNVVSRITGSGWPEYPSSYQYIIPSGWEDVQVEQPVVSSSLGVADQESRSDMQLHQAGIRGCDYPSYSNRSAWPNAHASAESHPVHGKSHSGKPQDFCNESHKYGYWRPKRGSQSNNYESSARRSMQRPGRSISTIRRVNHHPRSPRINRAERPKAQRSSVDAPTHGSSAQDPVGPVFSKLENMKIRLGI